MSQALSRLRSVSFAVGLSYLTLLFVAMPVKYLLHEPLAVRIVGSLHGVLTVVLFALAAHVVTKQQLGTAKAAQVLVLSLIPFGFLVADRMLGAEVSGPSATLPDDA